MSAVTEIRASHLWPRDRFWRGDRLFVAGAVGVTVDEVQAAARPVDDAGADQTITMPADELIRVESIVNRKETRRVA